MQPVAAATAAAAAAASSAAPTVVASEPVVCNFVKQATSSSSRACSETLALSVIAEKALPPLVAALAEETEDHLKSATAWVLGQIGRHTSDHAKVGRLLESLSGGQCSHQRNCLLMLVGQAHYDLRVSFSH